MPRVPRAKARDDRAFDTTQLHAGQHGAILHRDYSAHFFRWSFARRLIKRTDHVLEIGCGEDKPLSKLLFRNAAPYAASYVGVDLNPLKPGSHQRSAFHGEFDFTKRYKELLEARPDGFDVVVHYEVIEHMAVAHGARLLSAAYACLRPGGLMLMSTPCYDGVRHAANHIHEYAVPELQHAVEKAGFVVERRFGTFMDIKHIGKAPLEPAALSAAVRQVNEALSAYYDKDALSCFFAPLYPDAARNNLWVCRRES